MMIKMQKMRHSSEYMIIDGVTDIEYLNKPIIVNSDSELSELMKNFIADGKASDDSYANSVWYNHGLSDFELEHNCENNWNDGYQVNRISYYQDGMRLSKLFDGEAFICNDDGKTIQKIPRGGCTSICIGKKAA